MAEVACDQVGHEDEFPELTIASGAGLGRLDEPVYGLNRAVAQRAIEAVQDAVPVSFQGQGELLEPTLSHMMSIESSDLIPLDDAEVFENFLTISRGLAGS